jgi:hypothetical protein
MVKVPAARKKSLAEIAGEMRGRLQGRNGYEWLRLSGGLEIVFSKSERRWTLVLKRTDVEPSAREVEICRKAFGTPEGAGVRRFARRMLTSRTKELALYRGVELAWWETE